ncbi:MAG: ABC transporter ATP-binding protein/permease [Candidimonas sp.]|nr:MAG: ABC transporter ATP-binding protein/permease [Candidimonas sp.]TAM18925.1 MAG: ABC transporter ATP-binding protein/permease [Candidimonas sp.]
MIATAITKICALHPILNRSACLPLDLFRASLSAGLGAAYVSGMDDRRALPPQGLTRAQSRWLSQLYRLAPQGMAWAVIAPLAAGLLLLVQTWAIAQVLGQAIAGHELRAAAIPLIVMIGLLIALRAVLVWSGERAASRSAERIKANLRLAFFERMLALGPQWTRQRISGELASTIIEQIEVLDGFFIRYLPSAIAASFLPLAFGLVLLPVDWIAALILLLSAPLIPVFMALVGWGAEAASRKHQLALVRLSGFFSDRLRGAFTLKLFGRAQAEADTVRAASDALAQKNMVVLRLAFLSSAVLEFFAALGVAGVALYVGLSYLGYLHLRASALTLPWGLFCLLLAPEVYNPLRQFAANYHDRAAARAAVGHIAAAFDALPAVDWTAPGGLSFPLIGQGEKWHPRGVPLQERHPQERHPQERHPQERHPQERHPQERHPQERHPQERHPHALLLQTRSGSACSGTPRGCHDPRPNEDMANSAALTVRQLTLYAPDRSAAVLDEASFTVGRDEKLALMGESGAGKTSLLEVLLGLRAVQSGEICLFGQVLAQWTQGDLRRMAVLIGQQPFFLPGSIADNLRLAQPQASEESLRQALEAACAEEFVAALPQGLHTVLGAEGYGLSGGQLHRLALARVFLTSANLILLDEPTAHLDSQSRDKVMNSLLTFAAARTLIVATHDPAVAARLQRTLQIRDGKVLP